MNNWNVTVDDDYRKSTWLTLSQKVRGSRYLQWSRNVDQVGATQTSAKALIPECHA